MRTAGHGWWRRVAWAGVCALFLGVMPVSEWLAGGWDPGVYTNQALFTARHGPGAAVPSAYSGLAAQDVPVFSRARFGRPEAFPGVPVEPGTGVFDFYFYPVTPLWMALLFRVGGPHLAWRAMAILGLAAGMLLYAGLRRAGGARAPAATAALLLPAQPIVLYHLHTPCSEMLELSLMSGLLLVLAVRRWWLLFPLVAVGCLNRPGFLLTGGLLALLLALRTGGGVTRREAAGGLLWILAGLAPALCYYHGAGAGSVVKIRGVFALAEWAVLACLVAAWALVAGSGAGGVPRFAAARRWAACALPAAVFLAAVLRNPRGLRDAASVGAALVAYTGVPLLLAAAGGLAWLAVSAARRREAGPVGLFLLLGLAWLAVPLGNKQAADLYPWATKRFLSTLPLVVAVGGGGLVQAAAGVPWRRLAAGGLLLLGVGCNLGPMTDAWRRTEYRGLYNALSQVAAAMGPSDLVLADHFRWAAPLALAFGRPVLNGEPLWQDPDPARVARAAGVLAERQAQGKRIVLLTSTEAGAAVFPAPFSRARPLGPPLVYRYEVIAHHRRARGFRTRAAEARFLLSEWIPDGEAP